MSFSSKDPYPEIIFQDESEGLRVQLAYAHDPETVKACLNSLHDEEITQSEAIKAEKRREEYIVSRWLARKLLGTDAAILRGDRSPPKWPIGARGSISHKNGIAAVAIFAPFAQNSFVGIDIERQDSVGEHLERSILTPSESKLMAEFPGCDQDKIRALIFSYKESIYKALNPIESVFFWFEHASIEKIDFDNGTICARLNLDVTKHHKSGAIIHGKFHTIHHSNQNFFLTIARASYP